MNVGSLFSGIGGFDLGFERAGMHTSWFCEQDEFCQRVLAHHWPGVPCYPDVQRLTAAHVAPVDVLCGGFPCQDISVAGGGAGLAGARSGLWSEYARLIGELRPRYVVVENVSALLARGLGRVLGDLAALGYDAEWDCIPASALGAPHQRDRVWLVAYPGGQRSVADAGGQRGAVGGEAANVAQTPRGGQGARQERQRDGHAADDRRSDVADAPGAGLEGSGLPGRSAIDGQEAADADGERCFGRPGQGSEPDGRGQLADGGWWAVEPDVGRVAHGVPARVDRLRALGNALVPQIAEAIGKRILEWEEGSMTTLHGGLAEGASSSVPSRAQAQTTAGLNTAGLGAATPTGSAP